MEQTLIFWTIVGMAVATYLPRFLPAVYLAGRSLRPALIAWLRLVPPAVLAAMLVPSLLVRQEKLDFTCNNLFFYAALIAFPVAWKSRSLFVTVLVGMGLVALGRYFAIGE